MMLAIHPQAWYNERADEMTCRASGAQQRHPGALPVYSKRECNRTPSFFAPITKTADHHRLGRLAYRR